MKNKMKKCVASLLVFVMVFTAIGVQMPVAVEAATKITFSCTAKTVAIGGTYALTVQGVTDKKATYAWSSADTEIAKVSKEGVVTGVSKGSTVVKCKITLSDKSTKTLSCDVTVQEQKAATAVEISNAKLGTINAHTIKVGESYDFNRTIFPSNSTDKTYWYVLDEEYAKVDSSGVVTAKKEGMTILVARSGIDRIDAESLTNTVIDYVILNLVASSTAKPTATPKPTAKPTATPTPKPTELPTPTPLPAVEKIRKADVGDYVTFGSYEQDNNTMNGNEAIEWIVLEKNNDMVLLLSRYALDALHINDIGRVTWDGCYLRVWLNDTFYNKAFNSMEKKYVEQTTLSNAIGSSTKDNVFLLSKDEAEKYFGAEWSKEKSAERFARATNYTKTKNISVRESGYCDWWLRSVTQMISGDIRFHYVESTGDFAQFGHLSYVKGVRPAIWVKLPELPTYTIEQASKANVGDYVAFGEYEQDNNTANGAETIQWQVLDKKDGKLLLMSKYALDAQPYHEVQEEVTWETCTLRSWLNEEFYNTAFNSKEQKYIKETYVVNEDNPEDGTEGGNDTYDNVFLLSIGEVTTYFDAAPDAYDPARMAQVTEYAKAQGGYYFEKNAYYGNGWWWLRSPGSIGDYAAVVYFSGYVSCGGNRVDISNYVVRPALWVEVE